MEGTLEPEEPSPKPGPNLRSVGWMSGSLKEKEATAHTRSRHAVDSVSALLP